MDSTVTIIENRDDLETTSISILLYRRKEEK